MIPASLIENISKIASSKGFTLYRAEFQKVDSKLTLCISFVKKIIDTNNNYINTILMNIYSDYKKKDSISLDECAMLSNLISPILDVELQVEEPYNLEIGSPGIERILKSSHEFSLSIGELVSIKLFDKSIVEGYLLYNDNSSFNVVLNTDENMSLAAQMISTCQELEALNTEEAKLESSLKRLSFIDDLKKQSFRYEDCKKVSTIFKF